MTRRSDQLDRIEAAVRHLTETVNGHAAVIRDQLAAVRLDAAAARTTAQSVHAGIQALHDMLADQVSQPPSGMPPAAGGGTAGGEPAPAARRTPTRPSERM